MNLCRRDSQKNDMWLVVGTKIVLIRKWEKKKKYDKIREKGIGSQIVWFDSQLEGDEKMNCDVGRSKCWNLEFIVHGLVFSVCMWNLGFFLNFRKCCEFGFFLNKE